MYSPTAEEVKILREKSGAGMMESKKALVEAEGDILLAEGILRYRGLAVNIVSYKGLSPPAAYDAWVMDKAREYARGIER